MTEDFATFMKRRVKIAQSYVNGDAAPLDGVLAAQSPATFFGPGGGAVTGADVVKSSYDRDALSFAAGGETDLEVLHMGGEGDVGYWVGFQNAKARLKGRPEPVAMRLRVTEIFRKANGAWRMVHRHADMLNEERRPI